MEIIERIYNYLAIKKITPYEFERKCEVSNGYLNSRKTGTRGIGSEILEKIYKNYPDLNLIWLITGDGEMIADLHTQNAHPNAYPSPEKSPGASPVEGYEFVIERLKMTEKLNEILTQQNATLIASNADKERIIAMLDTQNGRKTKVK